jgi:hypothetical protein
MSKKASLRFIASGFLVVVAILSAFAMPSGDATAKPSKGCVDGGMGYVGTLDDGSVLNWHGTYIISLCPGATGPQDGDSNVQHRTYPDGTTENYKVVYSTADLTGDGVFCYWDLTVDPGLGGDGYYCPAGPDQGHLYWYIVSSWGDSPYLEPNGGTSSNPNGIGVYK